MGLLAEAKMEQSAAKVGIYGPQGSGKTTVSAMISIGLSISYHQGAPVAFFDTEKGSDFTKPIFDKEGIKLLRSKSRAFVDLLKVVKEAEQAQCCAMIVDSMTHVWNDLMDSFCQKKRIKRIEFQHWRELKASWREWTDLMLNSQLHMIIAGRAGNVYEYQENEETGKRELITTGTKMRAEGEFGYEPDVLLELWNEREAVGAGSKLVHHGIALKDRSWSFNGHEFIWNDKSSYAKGDWKLVYSKIEPYFKFLNVGGPNRAIDSERDSQEMFESDGAPDRYRQEKSEREQLLEEIENTITIVYPGQDQKSKRAKLLLVEGVFSKRSWIAVTEMPRNQLIIGRDWLRAFEQSVNTIDGEIPYKDQVLLEALSKCKPVSGNIELISSAQVKLFWSRAHELGWTDESAHEILVKKFSIDSVKKIPVNLFSIVMKIIESGT